jgi:hypothetical protein
MSQRFMTQDIVSLQQMKKKYPFFLRATLEAQHASPLAFYRRAAVDCTQV